MVIGEDRQRQLNLERTDMAIGGDGQAKTTETGNDRREDRQRQLNWEATDKDN